GLPLHRAIPPVKSQVRHPLLDPQSQIRPVSPPSTGLLYADTQRQPQIGIPLHKSQQSNDHHTINQTPKLTKKGISEPFLSVLEKSSQNLNGKEFPDYDNEEYYYYDEYEDTYYDDYDYGLSGSPITPLPFHFTTTNHVDPTVTTTQPSVSTQTRSRGPITPPPSLFPVRPGQTKPTTASPSLPTKQPFHSSTESNGPFPFGISHEENTKAHLFAPAARVIKTPAVPRVQVFNALQSQAHSIIQQDHPLHEFFIGDTSGIERKQSSRFRASVDIPVPSTCPDCSTHPDKVIFPASPPGLRAPLSQDHSGVFHPDSSRTLVLSSHVLRRLHHSHTTAAPDEKTVYFTPHHIIAHKSEAEDSISQTSSSPLRRLRRRKRRRNPSDYTAETTKKKRRNRVPQHVEKTDDSSSDKEIIRNFTNQNHIQTIQSDLRELSIQNVKKITQITNQELEVINPRNKLAQTVDFQQRNPTRKPWRINNKTSLSQLAIFNANNSTNHAPASVTYNRLPLARITANEQKFSHTHLTAGGITVQPRSVPHLTQSLSSNNVISKGGNYMGHALISPFSGVPNLESASPQEISRKASEAVQGWRQDLTYPVVDLPLPSAALSGLPFVIDGHKHLGTFVVVPVT
ncbi:unnamed protein product, partial [Meganyctiphanes norvegica]